jgi:hypothetical protein
LLPAHSRPGVAATAPAITSASEIFHTGLMFILILCFFLFFVVFSVSRIALVCRRAPRLSSLRHANRQGVLNGGMHYSSAVNLPRSLGFEAAAANIFPPKNIFRQS